MKKVLLIVIAVSAVVFAISALLTPRVSASGSVLSSRGAISDADFHEAILADSTSPWERVLTEMPEPTTKMKIRMRGQLAEVFNDSNYIHWADAEKIGIAPLTDTRSHFRPGRDMVKIASCRDFYLEPLTHSAPYLVPEAAAMLHEIGRRFNDSLAARGGGNYRIRVTSVLRTPDNVSRLRRTNRNAVDSSVHQLGTTVDITYSRFACYDSVPPFRSTEDLKNLLGEVLLAMREEGKIWVKYERHQPCYHISARPRN